MPVKSLIFAVALCAVSTISLPALAADHDALAVYSTQASQGSMVMKGMAVYTKKFDISLANLSDKPINLEKLCLKAIAPDGKSFNLDSVDEKLVTGTLASESMVKGFAVFASTDAEVYNAALIKAASDCTK